MLLVGRERREDSLALSVVELLALTETVEEGVAAGGCVRVMVTVRLEVSQEDCEGEETGVLEALWLALALGLAVGASALALCEALPSSVALSQAVALQCGAC